MKFLSSSNISNKNLLLLNVFCSHAHEKFVPLSKLFGHDCIFIMSGLEIVDKKTSSAVNSELVIQTHENITADLYFTHKLVQISTHYPLYNLCCLLQRGRGGRTSTIVEYLFNHFIYRANRTNKMHV